MREWWNNLALREKQMVSTGAFVVCALLLYVFIWSPLDNTVDSLRNQIKRNQELLSWMQDADKRIQQAAKTTQKKAPTTHTGSLLSIVQKQINHTPLVANLSQLHQSDNDSVQLTFQKIEFDKLMSWLIQLTQQEELVITQITVTPSATPGVVSVDCILKM